MASPALARSEETEEESMTADVTGAMSFQSPATLRVAIHVTGDRVTALEPQVDIPEWFLRSFKEMRSANSLISTACGAFVAIFFFLLGTLGSSALLMREGQIVWQWALKAGGLLALFMGLTILNSSPLNWMSYDTSTSASVFQTSIFIRAFTVFAIFSIVFTLCFAVAEALSRLAFPQHMQITSLLASRESCARPQTLERVLVNPFWT